MKVVNCIYNKTEQKFAQFSINERRLNVAQRKPRAMHVSIEKAIALSEKPPFDIIQVICQLPKNQKEVLK